MRNTLRNLVGLLLLVVIEDGSGMPQGFFSQALSIPKIVSWNGNDRSLAILPGVKVDRSSHISLFGKKNTSDKKSKKEQDNKLEQFHEEFRVDQTPPMGINPQEKPQQIHNIQPVKLPDDTRQEDQLISKFSVDDNAAETLNGEKVTTELLIETTTDDCETTTFDDELYRASPQLVASLLG